jgi:lysophospholipase L1-like esterase
MIFLYDESCRKVIPKFNYRTINILFLILLSPIYIFLGCDDGTESKELKLDPTKIVAVGESLVAGVQSNGLVQDFQENSFPFLISQQIEKEKRFEQPLIASPGLSIISSFGTAPLTFEDGQIVFNNPDIDPNSLLLNFLLPRPYNNLGIPGAELFDVSNTTSSDTNLFFEFILRRLGTQLEQTIALDPSLILLWLGNNDVLGAVTSGGNLDNITPEDEFIAEYKSLLEALSNNTSADIVIASIPDVTEVPFSTFSKGIFQTVPPLGIESPVPVIFDGNFNPIDFGDNLFIPILTAESDVVHLLFPAIFAYSSGIGIPDQEALENMGFSIDDAETIVSKILIEGLNPTGIPLKENLTLTGFEKTSIQEAVSRFNFIISELASERGTPVVDIFNAFKLLMTEGVDGFSGDFVLEDALNTAFSLDGIHPNNGGYAIIANLFIEAINESLNQEIKFLDTDQFRGQYADMINNPLLLKDVFMNLFKSSR